MKFVTFSIAFIITRMNWFRFMAPVIDQALGRGWLVECWLDVSDPMPHRPEDFPSEERVPVFKNGNPICIQVKGRTQIFQWIEQHRVDAVIDLIPPGGVFKKKGKQRSKYICLSANFDWIGYLNKPEELQGVDLFALNTPYWFKEALIIARESSASWLSDNLQDELSKRVRYIGWPQMDQVISVDQKSVRKRWGIPENKPVVVYFNWVNVSWPDFYPAIFSAQSLKTKIGLMLMYRREAWRALELPWLPGLKQIIQAIRSFCDRNNAMLVVKHRFRDRPMQWEIDCADLVVSDESYYPHTIFEVLSIASVAFGYFSLAVREAAVAGVPYVAMDAGGIVDTHSFGEKGISFYRRWAQAGGFFNYKGVVSIMNSKQIVKDLPKRELCEFKHNPDAAKTYTEKYLGILGGSNSDLCLDSIESLLTEVGISRT